MAKIAVAILILFVVAGEVCAGKKCKKFKRKVEELESQVEVLNEEITEIRSNSIFIKTECPIRECLVNEFSGTQYLLGTDSVNWEEARVRCNKCGYRLARIESSTEHTFVSKWLERVFAKHCDDLWCRRIWLDGTDQLQEGCWLYTTEPVKLLKNGYTAWIENEPSGGAENCLDANLNRELKWNDGNCKDTRPYLCERNGIQKGPLPNMEDVFKSGLC